MNSQRRSIARQATLRLILSLGLFVVLLGFSSYKLYSITLQKSAHERAEDLATFYQARLVQLDRDWDLQSREFKVHLEFTRRLEKQKTSIVNLQAFMTVQGANRHFQYMLIQDRHGKKVFDFGTNLSLREIPIPADQDNGWYVAQDSGNLYRVFVVPIWLGESGTGRMAVFYEIDNSLLFNLATPGIVLTVKYDEKPLASSLGQAGLENKRLPATNAVEVEKREIPWSISPSKRTHLVIDAPIKVLFTTTELAVGAAAIPLINGLILWFTLGFWLMRNACRIKELGGAVEEFADPHHSSAALEDKLIRARAGQIDEITEVADAVKEMAEQVLRRKHERRQAGEALRKSEANLHALLDNFPCRAWLKDTEGRYITINKVFADYLHLENPQQATGKTDLDLQPKELAEKYRADDALVMAARQSKRVEESAFDGTQLHWVEIWKTPIIDANGNVLGTAGFAGDITERKQVEEAKLRASDIRFHGIMEQIDVGIVQASIDDHIKQVNRKFCEITGYSQEELMHKRFQDIIFSDAQNESILQDMERLFAGEMPAFSVEKNFVRKDGGVLWVNLTFSLLRDATDAATYAIGVIEDFTERKRARETLTRYKRAIDNALDGFWTVDAAGYIQETNSAYAKISGYTIEELVNMHISHLEAIEISPKEVYAHINKIVARGYDRFETRHRHKDGHEVDIEVAVTHMPASGEFFAFIKDITERKQVEQYMHSFTAHLQAVREEEQAGIAREIHDDLGGTLTALKMEAHCLKTELVAKKGTEPLLDHLGRMSHLIDSASGVLRRIITGLRPTILDDLGLLAALEWQAQQFRNHSGIECLVNCVCAKDEECVIELDRPRSIALFRIAQEALTNVARHSGASRVEIEFLCGDEEIVLSVIDNGRGMTENLTGATTAFGIRGMRERVDQLGGTISFDTAPGGGLNVTVILPLPPAEEDKT